jgi:hypothetical protein
MIRNQHISGVVLLRWYDKSSLTYWDNKSCK